MAERRFRGGVTAIEVVILGVLAIMAIGMIVSAILQSRATARTMQCANNLRQIAKGLQAYGEVHDNAFPYGTIVDDRLPPERRWSWVLGAWPFVGLPQCELLVDFNGAWDADGNRPVRIDYPLSQPPEQEDVVALPWFRCPANPVYGDPGRQDATSYVGTAGLGAEAALLAGGARKAGIWGYDRQTRLGEIRDGETYTILLAETAHECGPWMAGGPPTVRGLVADEAPCVGPGRQFGGLHPGGANVAMADATVRMVGNGVDPEVFARQVCIGDAPAGEANQRPAPAVR